MGQLLDSLTLAKPGFFRWQAPDTLTTGIRLSCHAQGYVWKEIAIRMRPHQEKSHRYPTGLYSAWDTNAAVFCAL